MHISFSVSEGVKWVHWLRPHRDVTLSSYSVFCNVSAINKPWTVLQKTPQSLSLTIQMMTVIIMTSPSGMMLSWSPHLSCLSFTHLIAQSSAVQKCATWLKWSPQPPILLMWPWSPSLCGIALQRISNAFSQPHTKDTHIVFVTHILCIFSPDWTHTCIM